MMAVIFAVILVQYYLSSYVTPSLVCILRSIDVCDSPVNMSTVIPQCIVGCSI